MKIAKINNNLAPLLVVFISIMLIFVSLMASAQGTPRGDANSTNPMIIYSESWNPFYGNDGGNATLTKVKNVTLKNNMLAPDKPYRVVQKNLTTPIGDVELRKNGTVFKNCLLEGDISGNGEYYILTFQLLNQTQVYNSDDANITFQQYPELPNVICKFATGSTGRALVAFDETNNADSSPADQVIQDFEKIKNGNNMEVVRFSDKFVIIIIVALFLIIALVIIIIKFIKKR